MRFFAAFLVLAALASCEQRPAPASCPPGAKRCVIVDDYAIVTEPQGGHVWKAHGGEAGNDGAFVQYRQKRAIEVQSKCRIHRVLSKPGDYVLKASVHQCRSR